MAAAREKDQAELPEHLKALDDVVRPGKVLAEEDEDNYVPPKDSGPNWYAIALIILSFGAVAISLGAILAIILR